MSGKRDGKKANPPRRRETDFGEVGMPEPKSLSASGKPRRGHGSLGDQLTEQMAQISKGVEGYLDLERQAGELESKNIQGSKSGFEKRVNHHFRSGRMQKAGTFNSARVSSHGENLSANHVNKEFDMTVETTGNNTGSGSQVPEEIANNAHSKVQAAEQAFEEGRRQGQREGAERAIQQTATAAKNEAKGIWESIKAWGNENRGKLGVIVGAATTVGTTLAVATYRARQGDRMVYRQADGDTMAMGPEGMTTGTSAEPAGGNAGGGGGGRGRGSRG